MNVGSTLAQHYLQVQALTPQSGAPVIPPNVATQSTFFPFGLSMVQVALIGCFLLMGIIALLIALVQDMKKVIVILVIGFTTLAIPLSITIANRTTRIESHAGPEYTPKNVIVSNVLPFGFTVKWDTDRPGVGVVRVRKKTDPDNFSRIYSETESGDIYKHVIKVTELTAATDYDMEILSGGVWYDNQGVPLQVTTPKP